MQEQNLNEKQNKVAVTDRLVVYAVCAMILIFVIAFFVSDKKTFSENENRTLAGVPKVSFENIKSGAFTSGIETYIADHFPMRDTFLSLMTEAERISGRKEINSVYIADDGSLIEVYKTPVNTDKQIAQFTKLAENVESARCMLMLVPTATEVYSEKLPQNAGYDHLQQKNIDQIYSSVPASLETIDVSTKLKELSGEESERLYYRTDHHWPTYGAFAGYEAFCEAAGIKKVMLSDYEKEIVSDSFKGTVYSKLNDPYFGTDEIVSFSHPSWKLTVSYEDTGKTFDTPYNEEYLSQKDQYSYFLNNIHPFVTITNDAVEGGAIALVKDSYANSMIPFLLQNYHRVYVFDTRYYKGGPSEFINEHKEISDVLILYNMNTIDNDTGIGGIF